VHGQGGLFAVEDFSQLVPELSVEQQEQKVVFARSEGIPLCERHGGSAENVPKRCRTQGEFRKSMIVLKPSDLSKLPEKHRAEKFAAALTAK